jgi:hypothetical protein
MAGKPQVYTREENEVLRAALRELRDREEWSQKQVGEFLDIKQQNAGRLLGKGPAGFARPGANRLAVHLGFSDAEHFLREQGVLAALTPIPDDPFGDRTTAIKIALAMKVDQKAIDRVLHFYAKDVELLKKDVKWWATEFLNMDKSMRADGLLAPIQEPKTKVPPPPPSSATKREHVEPKRRARPTGT